MAEEVHVAAKTCLVMPFSPFSFFSADQLATVMQQKATFLEGPPCEHSHTWKKFLVVKI